jgi:hypothetical protein
MSGQMSSGEIEGVLASIRRLLNADAVAGAAVPPLASDDAFADEAAAERVGQGGADDGAGNAAAWRTRSRKLVLNPSARVDQGEPPRHLASAAPLVLTDPLDAGFAGDRAVDAASDPSDDDGPTAPSWAAPLVLADPVIAPTPAPSTRAAAVPSLSENAELARSVTRLPGRPGRPRSLEDRIAELEQALARDEAAWEPDGGEPVPNAAAPAAMVPAIEGPAEAEAPVRNTSADAPASDPLSAATPLPRLGPDDVLAWIEAESLRAFGAVPEEIAAAVRTTVESAAPGGAVPSGEGPSDTVAETQAPDSPAADAGTGTAVAGEESPEIHPGEYGPENVATDLTADTAGVPSDALAALVSQLAQTAAPGHPHPPAPVVIDEAEPPPDGAPSDPAQSDPIPSGDAAADGTREGEDDTAPDTPPVASSAMAETGLNGATHADPPSGPMSVSAAVLRSGAIFGEAAASDALADLQLDPATVAAIRAIATDVIRSELRGPLGEELTRNIRRLVRREIARQTGPFPPV